MMFKLRMPQLPLFPTKLLRILKVRVGAVCVTVKEMGTMISLKFVLIESETGVGFPQKSVVPPLV